MNTLFKAVKNGFTVKVKNIYIQVSCQVQNEVDVTRLALFQFSEGQFRSSKRNNDVVIWPAATILLLKLIIRRACTLKYKNSCTFVVMRLASGKHARPYEMGLSFIKRETKTRLWAFALHDVVEWKIVIKGIKMFLSFFIVCFAI